MFIITTVPDEHYKFDWAVVQVDMDRTDERDALDWGRYFVKFYIPHPEDRLKKNPSKCRFWPCMFRILQGNKFGDQFIIKPAKLTDAWLEHHEGQYEWKQHVENLAESALVGPFEINKDFTIPSEVWDALKTKAAEANIDVQSAFRIH